MWGNDPSKNNSNSKDDAADQFGVFIGLAFVGGMAVLFTVKYLPVVLVGTLIGFLIYTSRFHMRLTAQARYALFTAASFALLFFVLIGLPIDLKNRWDGILSYLPKFGDFCVDVVRFWNGLASDWFFGLFKKWQVRKLTALSISQYFWLSYEFGIALSFLFFGLGYFGKFKSSISEVGLMMASLPAKTFSLVLALLFSGWVRFGRSNRKEPGGWLLEVILSGALLGAAYYAASKAPLVPFSELKFCLTYLPLGPVAGLVLGFTLAFFPSGNRAIDFFFGKEVKLKQTELPGVYIGKTFSGRPYRLTERNLGYHVEIIAPTGSGKTNLLKGLITDRIQKGHGVIFLDFKAEFDIVSWISRAARSVNRENEIRLLSLSNRELSVPYNPLKHGDANDIQSALMNSMTWSESFYRGVAAVTLGTLVRSLCEYRDKTGEQFHLGHIYELLEQPALMRVLADKMAAIGCVSASKLSELAARIEKPSERSNLMGLLSNLNQILFSSAGDLLSQDVTQGSFDFREAITQGRISVMLMNSLKLKESANVIGKIILQDLMSFVGDHYAQVEPSRHKPITLIIDEFASFAMPTFIEFMDRARGAGIGIVVAHQARADLRSVSLEFQERIEANANTTLVSGVKSSSDAEYYSGMLGTKTTTKETIQKKSDLFFGETETGIKSIREVEEFVLHPNQLRNLSQGEVFAISRTIDPQWGLVNVDKASEFEKWRTDSNTLISSLKAIRASYQTENKDRYLDLRKLSVQPELRSQKPNKPRPSTQDIWK